MKLSEFDLNWYQQWATVHTPMDEYSRPGFTNFLGSIQSGNDISSLRHPIFPPVSGSENSTAYLTVNGQFLSASLLQTEHRWTPWGFERRCIVGEVEITSRTCMPMEISGVAMRLTFRNLSEQDQPLALALRMSGRCLNKGLDPWFWGVPKVGLTVTELHDQGGMNPHREIVEQDTLLSWERTTGESRACCAQSVVPTPHRWQENGDASWSVNLAGQESFDLQYGLVMAETRAEALQSREVAQNVPTHLRETEQAWRRLWEQVFSGGDMLSGQLQDIEVSEEIAPVGASAILSVLMLRRNHRPNQGKIRYSISMPRRVEACFYPNDWSMAARLLVELDPEPTWEQLEMALRADVRQNNQINTLTGKGGDANGPGWPYTIDIYNLFFVAWQFYSLRGATVLDQPIGNLQGTQTLLEVMEDLAFDWRSRRNEAVGLADYGPRQELLECVTTYEHIVAGLNAGAAWMLLRLSEIYRELGRHEEAEALQAEANGIIEEIVSRLYVNGKGWFCALQPDGSSREVRHCWDISMVLMCVGEHLPGQVVEEITRFFQTELQTPTWMCALSPHDGDAAVSGTRADHQYNGAFGSWPAFMSLGLLKTGQPEVVSAWLEGIARTARQGPFAQAYYTEQVMPTVHGAAAKVTDELPQCCHWGNISGGMFYEVLCARTY